MQRILVSLYSGSPSVEITSFAVSFACSLYMFVYIYVYILWTVEIECFSFIHASQKSYHFSQFKITTRLSLNCCSCSDFVSTLPCVFSPFPVHRRQQAHTSFAPYERRALQLCFSQCPAHSGHHFPETVITVHATLFYIYYLFLVTLCPSLSAQSFQRSDSLGNVLHSHLGLFSSLEC